LVLYHERLEKNHDVDEFQQEQAKENTKIQMIKSLTTQADKNIRKRTKRAKNGRVFPVVSEKRPFSAYFVRLNAFSKNFCLM
jgi:hypothetical protein